MGDSIKSALIWLGVALLLLIWLPMLAIRRLFDRDKAFYKTGKLFRKLGKAISKINPNWAITISGRTDIDDREPYIMVCNHLSQADIPLISNLPWEMKWVAKKELFDTPVVGWMMKLAGDISVDRRAKDRRVKTFLQARHYLNNKCSVFFFPEGTRSRNGKLNRFAKGAFALAVREGVPILPMVIDGTQNTLPKRSWKFGEAKHIKLKIMDPVLTQGKTADEVDKLRETVRNRIAKQLGEWRNKSIEEVDNLS
ncbi:1-acyl-sn-glycerol-3-phosphate acyltransferase [Aliifodinibius salicampi]|uniref:1-acyl-sn-glycerol-3-phosphate acyltransferase n=1 Tax=Fodinibius salicampi TaxID=1920655 RepID=A0ABT3PWD8_9BACT|nr:lysophospholipid acyltransferase family protein [Fodinibius salicampi]MCW9712111.1 1-acyl-sn-glycerol-3-phosphate acyltransferase [Fodinibius salicampi]